MGVTTWILIFTHLYAIGFGASLAAFLIALEIPPPGWEWVPDGYFVKKRVSRIRAFVMALVWPVAIASFYIVGRQMGYLGPKKH